jgi:flagellar hook-associated protein 1 FlgK
MSLFASLSNSVSALQAQSLAVQVTGKNLANVNNPGYARERVNFDSGVTIVTPEGAQSAGIEASVQQLRDALLDRQVINETALSSYYDTLQAAYQRTQASLGQNLSSTSATGATSNTASDTGIGAAIDDFFNAFQNLASNPTDGGARQALLSTASILTDRLQQSDQSLQQVQADLTTQVESNVSDANGLLATIANLNSQIGRIEVNHPGAAVDLRDQRQTALEKLAAFMPVTVTDSTNGQIQVSSVDAGNNPVVLVDLGIVQGAVAFNSSTTPPTVTAGTPATALALASGSIKGALDASSGAVQTLRDQLDAVAQQLVTSVNAAYGGSFFNSAGTTAGQIAIDSAVTASNLKTGVAGVAGDNTIALAIAAVASRSFSTSGAPADAIDGTISGYLSASVTQFGQALSTVNASVQNQTTIKTLVTNQRDSVSGVNLDEETANLMKYQRAFQASSRVFQTIDSLLDEVVNKL